MQLAASHARLTSQDVFVDRSVYLALNNRPTEILLIVYPFELQLLSFSKKTAAVFFFWKIQH